GVGFVLRLSPFQQIEQFLDILVELFTQAFKQLAARRGEAAIVGAEANLADEDQQGRATAHGRRVRRRAERGTAAADALELGAAAGQSQVEIFLRLAKTRLDGRGERLAVLDQGLPPAVVARQG